MKVLIAGALGQLGRNLHTLYAEKHEAIGLDLPDFDIGDTAQVDAMVARIKPDLIVNSAAYTNVDGCVENFELALRANAIGALNLARAAADHGAALVHISTNEVFPGSKPGGYDEWDTPAPINAYGRSKAAGEMYVRDTLNAHYIVRLSWLFAPGGRNFIHTVLRLADSGKPLRIVTDEIATPTYVADLSQAIVALTATGRYGTYHLVNEGSCSRYEFARSILALADKTEVVLEPILLSQFKRKSTPPPYCKLNNNAAAALGIRLRTWQEALADYVTNVHKASS